MQRDGANADDTAASPADTPGRRRISISRRALVEQRVSLDAAQRRRARRRLILRGVVLLVLVAGVLTALRVLHIHPLEVLRKVAALKPAVVPIPGTPAEPEPVFGTHKLSEETPEPDAEGAPAAAPVQEVITNGEPAAAETPLPDAEAGDGVPRPRPADYDFAKVRAALDEYLAHQPPERVDLEQQRVKLVSDARPHLMQLLNRTAYDDPARGVRLRSGVRLMGKVAWCAERGVTVQTSLSKREVRWQDLHPGQLDAFFLYYVRKRLTYAGTLAGGVAQDPGTLKAAPVKEDAAKDLLLLAILCDWYGRKEDAGRYARMALEYDPKVGVDRFMDVGDAVPPAP
jgi:hypothetical protein